MINKINIYNNYYSWWKNVDKTILIFVVSFFVAGLFQCLAFLPGFSRSGSCIIAFRMMGEDRQNSSLMSLYLGVPIILISFLSNFKDINAISLDHNLAIIFIVTFIFAYLSLKLFIGFINKIGFEPFVIYRLIFGIFILTILT